MIPYATSLHIFTHVGLLWYICKLLAWSEFGRTQLIYVCLCCVYLRWCVVLTAASILFVLMFKSKRKTPCSLLEKPRSHWLPPSVAEQFGKISRILACALLMKRKKVLESLSQLAPKNHIRNMHFFCILDNPLDTRHKNNKLSVFSQKIILQFLGHERI